MLTHLFDHLRMVRTFCSTIGLCWLLILLLSTLSLTNLHAQCIPAKNEIHGIVFLDKNLNGNYDLTDGLKNQTIIKAYDQDGQLKAQSVTDDNGVFKLSGLVDSKSYRLELVKPKFLEYAKSGNQGANDIKFVTSPSCNIQFGLVDRESNCTPENSTVFTTCFVKSGGAGTAPTLVQLPFLFKTNSPVSKIAMQNQTGSVWGLAWNKSIQVLYSSAFVKYGAELGIGGSGGIYVTNPATQETHLMLNLNSYGINTGGTNNINPLDCNYSDYVGKVGLGDMDISDDDQLLFVTNLYNKSLVIIPTDHPTAANIMEIKIPDPGCNKGDYVVGAVEYHKNNIYIAVTCTAETSKNNDDSYFHIYEFNLLTKTFNLIFSNSFAKNYWLKSPGSDRTISQWLTSIAFSGDDYMILGVTDRVGHTYCDAVYPLTGTYGDILMLWKDGSGWHLENKAVAGSRSGSGPYNVEGPGGGEFFGEDYWVIGPGLHPETSFGSVVTLNGVQEVISTVFDPVFESFSGGFHKYNTLDGKKKSAIQLYNKDNSAYGKSSGLGDLTLGCPNIPLEIGNYVWLDLNDNGIQDPVELPWKGLQLSLYDANCNLVANTITDNNGNYLFNSSNVDLDGDGIKESLKSFETYYIVVNDPSFVSSIGKLVKGTDTFKLSLINITPGAELINSDASLYVDPNCQLFNGFPVIKIHTGSAAQNDFSFDIGFVKTVQTGIPDVKFEYDLALIKKVNAPITVTVGDLVNFNITVYNQGNKPVNQIEITDYIQDYFTFESNLNPNWIQTGKKAKYIINSSLESNQQITINIQLRLNKVARPNEIINTAEISKMLDSQGNQLTDVDSTPDDIENNDKGGIPNTATDNTITDNLLDEDDHDRESLPIVDLALLNRNLNLLPLKFNELAIFEMEIFNQGNVAVNSYDIVNYIPSGLQFNAGLNSNWVLNGNKASTHIDEILLPGQSKKISIFLNLKSRELSELIDVAEISGMQDAASVFMKDFDSTPDGIFNNDKGGQLYSSTDNLISDDGTIDEDDQDPASVNILDLALILTTEVTTPIKKSQDVLFHITVCNQGSVAVKNIGIVDYVPNGLEISPLDNHGWFKLGGLLRNTIQAVLNPNSCITIDVLLRVKSDAKPDELLNRAEITNVFDLGLNDFTNRDIDSQPDFIANNDPGGVVQTSTDNILTGDGIIDEDDSDPAQLYLLDLALMKKYNSGSSLKQSGIAAFTIDIFNQGNIPAGKIEIIDYVPLGFSLSQQAILDGWSMIGNKASYSYKGLLLPGKSISINYSLHQTGEIDPTNLINRAEIYKVYDISDAEISNFDFDSSPDSNPENDLGGVINTITDNSIDLDYLIDEDDSDPAGIPVFDLALRKKLIDTKLAYRVGDTVEYEIQVFNQGNVIASNIEIVDYLNGKYIFDQNLNSNWSVIANQKVLYKEAQTLLPGQSIRVDIKLIIKELSHGQFIPNFAEIKSAKDFLGQNTVDFDSDADDIDNNDKGGQPGSLTDDIITDHGIIDEDDHDGAESNPVNFDLALIKDVDQYLVKRSELVNFKIKILNQGIVTCSELEIVDYIPEGLELVDPNWEIRYADPTGMRKAYYLLNEKNGRLPIGGLKSGDSLEVFIELKVDPNQDPGLLVNRAEIFKASNYGNIIDDDSQPDDSLENDKGGVVFEDSDGSSANPDPFGNIDDEDDADPAGIIIIDLERSIPCICLDNATNQENGQFYEELTFRSRSNDIWFIFQVDGLYDELSANPPIPPTPFITGPGGYILDELNLGDGTSIYTIRGKHIDGIGYSIVLSNQFGVKINSGVNKCFYKDPVLLKSQNNVCSGQTIRYEVKSIPSATYYWTLAGGGTILTNPNLNYIDVNWTGSIGSINDLTVDVNHPDSCYNPLILPVTIGGTSGTISCIGSLQVSLDKNCEVLVSPNMLLIGGPYDYNSYAVMIFNKDGSLVPNNTLYYSHIGKTFTVKVINVCNGNSCWSTVAVEDKIKPTVICLNDTIDCALMKTYLKPIINDNCDPSPERILLDERIENTPCNPDYSKIVTRTFVAKDHSGNISVPCTMEVFLKRIQLDSIKFPDSLTRSKLNPLICSRFKTDSLGRPLPEVTGIPQYRGLPAWPNNDSKYCDYSASFDDIEIKTGKDCVRKILRNWKFTIWYCTTFEQRVYPQLIEIVDTIAPTIQCPYDIVATTNSTECKASVWIPMPKVYDSCGQIAFIDLSYPGGLAKNFSASYIELPLGKNILTFTVYDVCYNSASCQFAVYVEDNTPPVAICDQQTVVTLNRFGDAWVPASVFDDGSYDDCHIKTMQVRRMDFNQTCQPSDNLFRDSIRFCCSDIGNNVRVVFKVSDYNGNENTCMVIVEVQDKTIPHIFCPHDVTISCDYHYNLNDLSEFGTPTVSDNCNLDYTERLDVQIDQCREGFIDRIFIAGNAFGQDVCVQRISIVNPFPFTESDIIWPLDLDTNSCITNGLLPETLPAVYGYPRTTEDFCDLIGTSYTDHVFRFINGSDACYKILRKWKIVNWCRLYNPATGEPIVYTHEQIIKIFNTDPPEFTSGCHDSIFTIIDTSCQGGDAYLVATGRDLCTPSNELVWEYHIDLFSDHIEDASDLGVGDRIVASGFYPLGKHKIKYVFEDRCGNKAVCERNFEIINCKPPTAYCIVGLSASLVAMDLNGNGSVDAEQVTIWAKDFDKGSYHPCGYPLTYSFGKDTTVKSITYDCDSIGRRTVTLCVTASNGKQDCCNSFIEIQDNNNVDLCGCVTFPPNITINDCSQNTDPDIINSKPSIGNCTSCIHTGTSYKDSTVLNIPNSCFAIQRTWTVTFNCVGEPERKFDRIQTIIVTTDLRESDINWPNDSVIVDNCRGSIDTADIGEVPRFCVHNGYVMLMYTDREIRREQNCVFYERIWTVFSKCAPSQSFGFRQVLKVIEGTGIRYMVPANITVTDCKKPLLPDSLNGFPKTNCPCNFFVHTYVDSVVMGIPNTCYVVYRKWTSFFNCPPDVSGSFKGTQIITIRIDLKLSDIKWPKDTVIVTNCPGSVDTGLIDNVPKLLKDFCGYVSIKFSDQTISKNDTCKYVRRTWVVANECSIAPNRQQFSFIQILKVTNPDGPRVTFPADITVTDCKKSLSPDSLNGFPMAKCTCDTIKVSFKDDTIFGSNPEVCYIVERNWAVRFICKPKYDSTVFKIQKITRDVNLDPSDITWPKDSFTSFTCTPTTDPKITGQPTLKKDYCGLVTFSFTDTIVGGGECRTIKRTWTAINSCSISQRPKFIQYIITKNQTAPSITCANDTIVNADPNTCGKVLVLKNPKLNNSCNTGVTFTNNAPPVFPVGMTFVIFTASDTCNHTAQCTVKVTVIENVPPKITCPQNLTVPCSTNTDSTNQFGTPVVTDNCPGVTYKETVTRSQNVCGIGTITRKFVAIDASGNKDSCTQIITINNPNPLDTSDMIWPPSPVTVDECESIDPSNTGFPQFDSTGITCLKAKITFADTNQCKFSNTCDIERTWVVFDSCSGVTLTFVQLITRDDTTGPNILGVSDTTQYANDSACNNFVTLIAFVDNCDSASIVITNNSPFGKNTMEDASGFYPVGTTVVTFTAEDACCNISTKKVTITIIDTIAPEFTCRKVVKKIQDDGCAKFNSQEFVTKLKDNCTDSALIKSSFNRSDFSDTIRIICCDSITNFEYTTAVKVYFMDQAGNMDSCCTFLQAVDEDTICGPTFISHVKGFVKTRKMLNMPGVGVMLNQGLSGYFNTMTDGFYAFRDMPNGGSYLVSAEHDINPLNGVSTADIIHIQRHILGLAPFTDPLRFVAADVNNNKKVTAADIVEIRKLILGKIDRFTNSPSWKFLLSDYKFKDKEDPLTENYQTSYQITNINRNYYIDFTGIKMGDVDDSNDPANFGGPIQSRNLSPVLLTTNNTSLYKDQVTEIEFEMSQFNDLEGMQFEIHVDPSKAVLQGIVPDESGLIKEDAYNFIADKNCIRISYVKKSAFENVWKLKLSILVKKASYVSEVFEIINANIIPEAYLSDGSQASIYLDYLDQNSAIEGLTLFQNIPNPFSQSTIIPFQTTDESEIAIRVLNMNGKIVYESKGSFTKGYHEFEINKKHLDKSGIYFYQLKTNKSTLFRRMILID